MKTMQPHATNKKDQEKHVRRQANRLLHAPGQLLHRHLHLRDALRDVVELGPRARQRKA